MRERIIETSKHASKLEEPRCEDCGHVGFVQIGTFAHKMFCEFYGTSHPKATECKHFVEAR